MVSQLQDPGVISVPPEGPSDTPQTENTAVTPKKLGRPKKADIVSKTKGHIAKRGRPPGEAAAMADFKARLINSPKSRKVIEKIYDAALNDDHKNQSAAWKLIVERLAPISQFEKGSNGKPTITINIGGINDTPKSAGVALEGEYEPYEEAEDEEQEG